MSVRQHRRTQARAGAAMLALAGGLAACAGGTATSADGTWVGRLQTVSGTCPDAGDSDLVVSETQVTFVPGDGVLSLIGKRAPGSTTLHAQRLGIDVNHKPLPMVLDANFVAGGIAGDYGTPTCRATITLHRPTHTAVQRLFGD